MTCAPRTTWIVLALALWVAGRLLRGGVRPPALFAVACLVALLAQPHGQRVVHGGIAVTTRLVFVALQLSALVQVVDMGDALPQREAQIMLVELPLEQDRQ